LGLTPLQFPLDGSADEANPDLTGIRQGEPASTGS
jgi:hypothetical protein